MDILTLFFFVCGDMMQQVSGTAGCERYVVWEEMQNSNMRAGLWIIRASRCDNTNLKGRLSQNINQRLILHFPVVQLNRLPRKR